jgi:hypothetical protein
MSPQIVVSVVLQSVWVAQGKGNFCSVCNKLRGISWPADRLVTPLERFCFVELVTSITAFMTRKYKLWRQVYTSRFQWPHGPRRVSAAARLMGLWVRISRGGTDVSVVSVVCCQVEVSTSGWSLVQRSPTECGVSNECDRERGKFTQIKHCLLNLPLSL